MAVGEARKQARSGNVISQVSWTDGVAQDVYYGLEHSFQYSSNINCDDELHGIKLSTYAVFTENFKKSQLTSVGDNGVVALRVDGGAVPKWFDETTFLSGWTSSSGTANPDTSMGVCPGTVFQDFFWYGSSADNTNGLVAKNVASASTYVLFPVDHNDYTDDSIGNPDDTNGIPMIGAITAILNYNNTRLVVACGSDIWVYYPELDMSNPNSPVYDAAWAATLSNHGKTGWKKVLSYEAGVVVVGLTCSFEYLKVWCVDEGWNSKVYFYQGNNNLRSTFVYNEIDLTGVRITRVYSINGIDYYVSSIDGTDGFVNLYKMVGTTPVQLFKQRAGLSMYDVNYKAPYFFGPVGLNAAYYGGKFYIADAYGLFQFTYTPDGYDKGYMKRGLYNNKQVYGVCLNKHFLYVSTEDGCYMMRVIDTGLPPITASGTNYPGYQDSGVLISREFEGKEGGTVTKMLDEIRMNFELNPLTNKNGTIDVYVSPNNLWTRTNLHQYTDKGVKARYSQLPDDGETGDYYWVEDRGGYYTWDDSNDTWDRIGETLFGWYHAMHITQESAGTRTEKSNLFNDLHGEQSSFKFDWQTITYAIVITRGQEKQATPIVRELDIRYHCKDKVNNVYDIN